MSLESLMTSTITIIKKSGHSIGPLKAQVGAGKIITLSRDADFERGDMVTRTLPNKRVETYYVVEATYHDGGTDFAEMSNWEVTVTASPVPLGPPPRTTEFRQAPSITVHAHAVQIGDGNTQNIADAFYMLASAIDSSSAPEPEKTEAKGRLSRALEHPLIAAALGSVTTAVIDRLSGRVS